jgi:hypothetical protein
MERARCMDLLFASIFSRIEPDINSLAMNKISMATF